MFQVWREGTQKMGMFKDKREKKKRESGTPTKSVEEGEGTLWSKGTASKRSSDEYGGVDNMGKSGDLCRVQGMQL